MSDETYGTVMNLLRVELEEAREAYYKAKAASGDGAYRELDRIAYSRRLWMENIEDALADFRKEKAQ